MRCGFCTRLRDFLRVKSGPDCDALWDDIWTESDEWERIEADQHGIWHRQSAGIQAQALAACELDQSDAATVKIYKELADAGSVWSMETVALHYHIGLGVAPDFDLAQDYYRSAISGGSWMATLGYARLLANHGHYDHCERILEDGVDCGFAPAYFWLGWFRHDRPDSNTTRKQVRPLLEYAANKGHPGARAILTQWLIQGKLGVRGIFQGIGLLRGILRDEIGKREFAQ